MLSTDAMRITGFTEDVIGDRVGFALHMRNLLTDLRFGSRIKMFINWTIDIGLNSLKGMPTEVGAGYNAYANMLGNASFVKEYHFADSVRTYVFDDGKGGGIAALWDHDEALARRDRSPYRLILGGDARAADTFGRTLPTAKIGEGEAFEIDFVPVFVSAKSVKELLAVLDRSRISYGAGEAVSAALRFPDAVSAVLAVKNRDSKEFSGRIEYRMNSIEKSSAVKVPSLGELEVPADLSAAVDMATSRRVIDLTASIADASGKKLNEMKERYNVLVCERRKGPIVIDGDVSDWQGYRIAKAGFDRSDIIEYRESGWGGPQSLSAKIMTAWDDDALYLAVQVKDDVLLSAPTVQGAWNYDSLQVFIDAFKDATPVSVNMDDDYAYMIAKTANGDDVYRNVTPNKQIAWLENNVIEKNIEVKIARDDERKITVYELRMPKKYLFPVPFVKNKIIGLAVMVNDADDPSVKRTAALTTANGQEAWQKPFNLSYFIFE